MSEEKKEKKEKQSDLTKWGKLKCSKCNKEKMASGDRLEKWKGKNYICRDCKRESK
jgi:hypothetical protein